MFVVQVLFVIDVISIWPYQNTRESELYFPDQDLVVSFVSCATRENKNHNVMVTINELHKEE